MLIYITDDERKLLESAYGNEWQDEIRRAVENIIEDAETVQDERKHRDEMWSDVENSLFGLI